MTSDRERKLAFTHWASVTAKSGTPVWAPWSTWRAELSKHERRPSKDGPCLTLCNIVEGKPRRNKNVVSVDGLCLDIDTGTDAQIADVLAAFKPFEYALHSTHSNRRGYAIVPGTKTDDNPDGVRAKDEHGKEYLQLKVRAVFPLDRAITPTEHAKIWPIFSAMAKGFNDEKTKAVSHPFYLPAAPAGAEVISLHNAGDFLKADDLLAKATSSSAAASSTADIDDPALVEEYTSKARNILRRMPKAHELRTAATAVGAGEPFAKEGERHDMLTRLTGYLAFKSYSRPFPAAAIENVFRKSIVAMQAIDADCDGLPEVVLAYETACDKAKDAKQAAAKAEQTRAKTEGQDDDFELWSRDDLEEIAKVQGVSDPRKIRYIVAAAGDNNFFVCRRDGYFEGPLTEKKVVTNIFQNLAASPIELFDTTGDAHKRKPLADLMIRYGENAEETIADLTIEHARYDAPFKTLYEATKPIRYSQLGGRGGAFNKEIDRYIRLLGGTETVYRKLCAWLACLADLRKMLCALVITGEPGVGKTLFAHGCANLWADTPAPPEAIVGDFNQDLVKCPLVFADEILPKSMKWESVTAKLRAEIGILSRTLQRKFMSGVTLRGALRFILATNNPMILKSEISTAADLTAIAQRFLYVEPDPSVNDYLNSFSFDVKNRWRTYDFPRHCLWLAENWKVEPEGRFWVMGDVDRMHRLLVTSSNWNSRCCEWMVKGLSDGFRKVQQKTETAGYVKLKGGKLYVNTNAIVDGWSAYVNYPNEYPDPRHVATALRSIAVSSKQVSLRDEDGKRTRYFEIDVQHLIAWAEEQGTSDREEIEKALGVGIRELPKVIHMHEHRDKKK